MFVILAGFAVGALLGYSSEEGPSRIGAMLLGAGLGAVIGGLLSTATASLMAGW